MAKIKRHKKQVVVRGNMIYFHGKTAVLVARAIALSGLTPEQFINRIIRKGRSI